MQRNKNKYDYLDEEGSGIYNHSSYPQIPAYSQGIEHGSCSTNPKTILQVEFVNLFNNLMRMLIIQVTIHCLV